MFVLGIDPGLSRCGYGVVERRASQHHVHAMGVLRTSPDDPVADRLAAIADDMRELLAEHPVDVVALERILFQVNVRTAIGVAQATGVIMAEARRGGADVAEYSPNTVKQTVAGDGAADKSQMERMVRSLLKIDRPIRPVDAADAVGVALCHLAHAPMAGRVRAALSNGPGRDS
ncbi:MAG TPA: crossover junction endodeoxyribonuclease RuvC [Acidimicrobiales bacterium]|nr:crossover junction endodeoxyribonuclease RuvC [Acidimicrobiales bacterium]